MKIKLGEFKDGQAKGFKYYYPEFESHGDAAAFFMTPQGETIYRDYLLEFLNTKVKQAYSERVRVVKLPKAKSAAQMQQAMELLASQYPDGVLYTQDEVVACKPWLTSQPWEAELAKLMEIILTLPQAEQVERLSKIRAKMLNLGVKK